MQTTTSPPHVRLLTLCCFGTFVLHRIHSHQQICDEEISACCLDDRRRKIILGDIKGKINVYNCSNGALMKTVHKAYGSTCVSLIYFDEAKRFIAGFARGQVCIFDENVLEECILIRQFECYTDRVAEIELKDPRRAGGKEAKDQTKLPKEMLSVDFDDITHTVATAGATDGILRFWDYDSSKCTAEVTVCDVKISQIVHMKMLHPYPLVVTSDSSGNIVVWGCTGCKWSGMRLSGFLNMTPASADHEPKPRQSDETDTAPRRALPPRTKTPMNIRRAEELAQLMASSAREEGEEGEDELMLYKDVVRSASVSRAPQESQEALNTLREQTRYQAEGLFLDSEAKWGRCSAAHATGWHADGQLLITGDDLGHIRCFSLHDAMVDMQKDLLMDRAQHDNQAILGLCRDVDRDDAAALAPVDHEICTYLLARPYNNMSYLGVRFCWSLYAHSDRIISCTCTPNGVLTSAADRLVKMWDFEGKPLGTLLQSVPVGMRSKTWDLILDVKEIMEKENEELDEIIERVTELAQTGEKPDIYSMDFSGMELGAESANFSQSVLRQRIERTAKILGIDFPTSSGHSAKPGDGGGAGGGGGDDAQSVDLSSVAQSVSSTGGKSLADALSEIKSTESGVDYEFKTKSLSYIQQRRKANKLENISKMYEEKSGVKLNTTNKEISIWEEDNGDSNKAVDFDKLLSNANVADKRDDASINDDLYSVDQVAELRTGAEQRHQGNKSHITSKIADSIKQVQARGPRTISMLNSCRKYQAFGALDQAIQTNGAIKQKEKLSEEEATEIRTMRERKIRSASMVNTGSFNLKERKASTALQSAGLKLMTASSSASILSGSPSSQARKSSLRGRLNSMDTGEGTDDSVVGSLKHQFTALSLTSDSPKGSTRFGRLDSPSDRGSGGNSPMQG